jgi:predicted kinase
VATLTLFCGLPGSGKTTLARRLEAEERGIRISTDEWQGAVGVVHSDHDFHERLQAVLYRHALLLLRAGCDVILEDGLWTTAERAQKFADARECGARIELHVFEVDVDTLWTRLQGRNADAAAHAVPISSADLRRASDIFQPVTDEELNLVDRWFRRSGGLSEPPLGTVNG